MKSAAFRTYAAAHLQDRIHLLFRRQLWSVLKAEQYVGSGEKVRLRGANLIRRWRLGATGKNVKKTTFLDKEWKMKRFMVFVLMVLTAFGCVSCAGNQQAAETQNAETTPWTIEGAFCDDAENPRYLLDIAL